MPTDDYAGLHSRIYCRGLQIEAVMEALVDANARLQSVKELAMSAVATCGEAQAHRWESRFAGPMCYYLEQMKKKIEEAIEALLKAKKLPYFPVT